MGSPELGSLVAERAARVPEAVALRTRSGTVSYGELRARSRRLARRLRRRGAGPEVVVGVCLERGPRLVEALLAVLEAGAAYLALDPAYPAERLRFMVDDAAAPLVIAEAATLARLPAGTRGVLDLDAPATDAPGDGFDVAPGPGHLAYLIYTSGSTGRPKGVAIERRSASALLGWALAAFTAEELGEVLAATSAAFDLSVFELFAPLAAGGTVVLARDALELAEQRSRGFFERLTLVNTVPSVMAELLREGALPPSVGTVNLAGEALDGALVAELHACPHVRRVLNLYGPSEDTTYSTEEVVARGERHPPIGRPIKGGRAVVLDARLEPVDGEGELGLGGPGLARGYLGRPTLTAERFVPDPFAGAPGRRLYRTGDLVRRRADGRLEFLGRLDHQVKLRGFRVELGEVEAALLEHPAVTRAVAVVHPQENGPGTLVTYALAAAGRGEEVEGLLPALARRLPAHMVPSRITVLDSLPRTPSGKVDRSALARRPLESPAGAGSAAPRTAEEKALAVIWAEVLEPPGPVMTGDDFFALGGHSLLGTRLLARVRRELGVELPLAALFEHRTVAALARHLGAAPRCEPLAEIPRLERRGGLPVAAPPLSFAQERMWFLERLAPGSGAYHVPAAWRLTGAVDRRALELTLGAIVRRHEALRTHYPVRGGRPYQAVEPPGPFHLPEIDLGSLAPAAREAEEGRRLAAWAREPFDLARGPVVRALFVRRGRREATLVTLFHHIATDDVSLTLFLEELCALYPDGDLAKPELQYADFAVWQRRWLASGALAEQLSYWRRRLAGAAVLELPTDRPRPAAARFFGGQLDVAVPAGLTASLRQLGHRRGASLFMVLLAAWKCFLARLTGRGDVVVGSPIAGRNRAELERVMGFFVNSLALRTDLGGDPSFARVLGRVRESALGAYAHQDLPFEKLVDQLGLERQGARNPLFQVMFALQTPPPATAAAAGVELEAFEVDLGRTRLDLEVDLRSAGEGLRCRMIQDRDLFDATTVRRFARGYLAVLEAVAAEPALRLSRLDLLAPAERHQALVEWNDTRAAYPREASLAELFARQVRRDPEAPAVVDGERRLSYGELDRWAAGLAARLRRLGVAAESPVGLYLERGAPMVAATLAALKAGGAYLPLDPSYPDERLAWMVEDARPKVLIADREPPPALLRGTLPVLRPDPAPAELTAGDPGGGGSRLAYLMYTSGSTGRPKGVMIEQRSVARLVLGTDFAHLGPGERLAQVSNVSFDAATFELWGALAHGACLVILPAETLLSPRALARAIAAERLSVLSLTMVVFHQLAREDPRVFDGVGQLFFGAETPDPGRVAAVREVFAGRLVHLYGPTESTSFATWHAVDRAGPGALPIGRPLANTRVVLHDRRGAPTPLGAVGEIRLGGGGLARGYLRRPALTAERFVPDAGAEGPGARLYRTGDLARHLAGGELLFLGRADRQFKVRGFRVEPGELESVLEEHPAVRAAAAVARADLGGGPRLVAWVAADEAALPELERYLAARLPDYLLPSRLAALAELPLTPNGKVDRAALERREIEAPPAAEHVTPRTPEEELVAGLMAEVLAVERVGADDDFFALGGHSLLAARWLSRLEETFGVELPLRTLFETPTPAGIVRRLRQAERREPAPPIERLERPEGVPEPVPLSFAQERLWFLDRLTAGESAFYNVPLAWKLRGPLRVPALAAALAEVERRHEVLRTRFPVRGERPLQEVLPPRDGGLAVVDLGGLAPAARGAEADRLGTREARRPFDLGGERLARALLLRLAPEESRLLVTLHHTVCDGWSVAILARELETLYAAACAARPSPLAELAVQYADFSVWQRRWLAGETLERQLAYWRQELAAAPRVEVAADRPRPEVQTFRGRRQALHLDRAPMEALEGLARRHGATLFMVLLAAWKVLLARLTGEHDVVVGAPVAGRTRPELEPLVGFFVNTLPLRARLGDDPTAGEAVARVRAAALGALAHQELPFERLVQDLHPERDLGRNPVFQTMFVLQNAPEPAFDAAGVTLEALPFEVHSTHFDLEVELRVTLGGIAGGITYDRDLFDATTIRRLGRLLERLLTELPAGVERPISRLELLTPAARHQLLHEWNDTGAGEPSRAAIAARIAAIAARSPAAPALTDGRVELDYRRLVAAAGTAARRFEAAGCGPGSLVAILCEPTAEMVVGMLGAFAAGAAYLPLDPAWPPARLAYVVGDARPAVVWTRGRLRSRVPAGTAVLEAREVLGEPERWGEGADGFTAAVPAGEERAYVIYTSGSTGRPKGVEISHRSLASLIAWHRRAYGPRRGERTSQVAGPGFDAAVWEIWPSLLAEACLVMAPGKIRASAPALGRWLAEEEIALAFLPTPLAEAVLRGRGTPGPALRALLVGGDHLHGAAVAAPRVPVVNLYGPTEATVVSTCWPVAPGAGDPPIGRPIDGFRIYLLDRRLGLAPLGAPGEIHIGGIGLARGYLGRPALTAERFVPHPFTAPRGERLYKTGDLARARVGGELEFLGRIDRQIKLRGLRIELGEIEAVLAEHPAVLEAAVVAAGQEIGEPRLVGYAVAPETDAETLERYLGERLPPYMVPLVVRLERLPLTPSGKVDRRRLERRPLPRDARAAAYVAPRTPAEQWVAETMAAVLGLARVGVEDHFFHLGGHSLLATRLVSRLERDLEIELPLQALFEAPTVAALARRLEGAARREPPPPIRPLARRGGRPVVEPPLSFAQERLWFLDRLTAGGSSFYNVPLAWRLTGPLEPAALAAALVEIVRRHEILRTSFPAAAGGRPVQRIAASPELPFVRVGLERLDPAAARAEAARLLAADAARPFDLARGPIVRAMLLELAPGEAMLSFDVHHVACDGWSVGVLLGELGAIYGELAAGRPSPLPELAVQYADFAVWQREWLRGEVLERQLAFWRQRLAAAPAVELPADRPRPEVQAFRGGRWAFRLGAGSTRALHELGRSAGATLFMVLLAAWKALLRRVAGQDDLVVGSPIAGRNRPEIEPLVGFFVNSLALRTHLGGDPTVAELLARVRAVALAAWAHQDLPFERLVEHLHPERDLARNPIFQVMFALQNAAAARLEAAGLDFAPVVPEMHSTHFDLEVDFQEEGEELAGHLVFDRDLFDPTTIQRLGSQLRRLLEALPGAAGRRLSELELIPASARHQALVEWNDARGEEPGEAGLAELFAARVARDPEAEAVVFPRAGAAPQRLSYGELDRRANRLAHRLIALGVEPESLVALRMERSAAAVWAILGILKAGGAYLPLDPAYPERRLAMMIDDARPRVLVTDRPGGEELRGGWAVIELDEAGSGLEGEPEDDPRRRHPRLGRCGGRGLAYVMYTSGSTGRPKGVMIEQRSIVRLVRGTNFTALGPRDRIAQVSNISFDAATFEIWGALLNGACLVGIDTDVLLTPRALERTIAEHGVTVLSVTMGPFHQAAREHPAAYGGLAQLFFGAEAADPRLVAAVRRAIPGRMVHLYGPTESTSFATWHPVRHPLAENRPLPIGTPLAHTRVLLLDRRLEPVPSGSAGEILLGGLGLARGYLHRPALAAERFVPDPFGTQGHRLYKTGDRARHLAGGEIEFLGRADLQLKVRGFRIEPGEVEAALAEHPAVAKAVVLAREDVPGSRRLVAYLVQDLHYRVTGGTDPEASWRSEQVEQWQLLFDDAYAETAPVGEGTFNIAGWKRTATGEDIPAEEMREWLDDTVGAILDLRPRRVLEIGCGTGLVLFQVAAACELYLGTDVSRRGLDYIESQRIRMTGGLSQVRLEERSADDFSGFEPGSFDLVVLNSVVQYFPSAEYLVEVIRGALGVLAPGGAIFLGDVRSLPLAEAFQAEAALDAAPDEARREELLRAARAAFHEEDELLVDPTFFAALAERLPGVAGIEISPKRGRFLNELSRYRYQVVVRAGDKAPRREIEWLDWQREGLTRERLRRRLAEESPPTLALSGIPNARLDRPLAISEALSAEDGPATAGEIRGELAAREGGGVDPEELWALGRELPYRVLVSWAGHGRQGRLLAFFSRRDVEAGPLPAPVLPPVDAARPWGAFTSRPLRGRFARRVIPELRGYLEGRLPDYMVPAAFVLLDELPLTPNGKIDRRALPAPEAVRPGAEGEELAAPRNPEEEAVAEIWADVLGLEQVGVEADFFDLGGHSLLATRVVSQVRQRLGVELPLRAVFQEPTVAALAVRVAEAARRLQVPPLVPAARAPGAPLPLSFAQQRLWFFDRLAPGNAFYVSPVAWRLVGPAVDPAAFAACLGEIARRHEVLRTTYESRGGEVRQVVHPAAGVALPVVDLAALGTAGAGAEARRLVDAETARPFELTAEPPLRALFVRLGAGEAVLVASLHHIAADGWSHKILLDELTALYGAVCAARPARSLASPLRELAVQYADFALWQRGWLAGDELERQLAYWRRELAGAPPLELPADRPRPPVQRFRGARLDFELPPSPAAAVKALGRRRGATPFMVTLAVFQTLLHRLTDQDDLVVGTPIANRHHAEIEPLIGFFVNSLVLRSRAAGDPSFAALLERARESSLGAYAHQDLPFDKLVEHLDLERDLSRNPLFQVMFALQEMPAGTLEIGDLTLEHLEFEIASTRFDLEVHLFERPDGGFGGMWIYDRDLFDAATVRRFGRAYRNLVAAAAAEPGRRLGELALLAAAERHQVLTEWNDAAAAYPREAGLAELFERRAAARPQAEAVVYLDAGGRRGQLTYGELDARAEALARRLGELGVERGSIVALALERGVSMVVAIVGILKAGGAYLPLDPSYPEARLRAMAEDARPQALVVAGETPAGLAGDWPAVDVLAAAAPGEAPRRPRSGGGDLAYVIYTSGSTGRPKGVCVAQRSVSRLVLETDYVALGPADRVAQVSNSSFDAATFEIWGALLHGATLVGIANDVLLEPRELAAALRREKVTVLSITMVLFHQLAREQPGVFTGLSHLLFGAEAAEVRWVRRVRRHFAGRMVHLYGPTECTGFATWQGVDELPADAPAVPIGRPVANTEALVLDRRGRPAPIGGVGEVHLGGDGLAWGYLRRPALSAERFVPHPAGSPGARLYRTGDLARRLAGGELVFAGRVDHQVKVRGFRVEPGEVEAVLAEHPAVREAAVVMREAAPGDRRLVAWVTTTSPAAAVLGAVETHLRSRLPAYLVPSRLLSLEEMPLTPNGKIDRVELGRRELPGAGAERRETYVAPRTPQEEILAEIWARILEVERVGVFDDFFDLGGHSLLATQAMARAGEALGVEIPLKRLFETPTVAGLAETLAGEAELPPAPPIEPQPRRQGVENRFPVTFSQLREWILDRFEPGATVYNISTPLRLRGELDEAALARAFGELVRRHEPLRTYFAETAGEPVQVVRPPSPVPLPVADLTALAGAGHEAEGRRLVEREVRTAFDLDRGPLVRSTLVRLAADDHLWLLSFHHSVCDGWSIGVFFHELDTLYRVYAAGGPAPAPATLLGELTIQYADFAVWQRRWLAGETLERISAFWKETLRGAAPVLELPTDRPRPAVRSSAAALFFERLEEELVDALQELARRQRATLYMVLLAGFKALLLRLTGERDLAVGTFIANRNRAETAGLIGFFTNTLVLRSELDPADDVRRAIAREREAALAAYAHQDLPFEKLLEVVEVERNPAYTPLFQVMLELHNLPHSTPRLAELEVEPAHMGARQADFDLELVFHQEEEGVAGEVKYATALFDATTVRRFVRSWKVLLWSMLEHPGRRLAELGLCEPAERHQVLHEWNDSRAARTDGPLPAVHLAFERQAGRTPGAPALIAGEVELGYAELDRRANRLAHHLRRRGIGPGAVVALAVPRSAEMVVALLAVLKAGGAYLPLDPEHPPERLSFVLGDARARWLLTVGRLAGELAGPATAAACRVLDLDAEAAAIAAESPERPELHPHPESLAYVLYTSGSTGEPKGVEVSHRAVASFLTVADGAYGLGPGDRVLQFAALTFDTSVEEIYPTLARGATLVLRPPERVEAPAGFLRRAEEWKITVLDLPTAYWHELAASPELALPASVRLVILGGEKAEAGALERWRSRVGDSVRLYDGYGPTEATVIAIGCDLAGPHATAAAGGRLPIGRPLANARVRLVDGRLRLLPVGVKGEIALGGPGLARGYLGRPVLSAERFVPDPWSGEPGGRLYLTGDVARTRGDGAMEFLGRVDDQVKIRGLRIEPGEVGAVLSRHPELDAAVVLARPLASGQPGLVAYAAARRGAAVTAADLRSFLAARLPAFMVPAVFLVLEELPTTASNKVDRRALLRLDPVEGGAPSTASGAAPRNELERKLAGIWARVLGLEEVGVESNFFDLGGDSLLVLRLHRRLEEAGHALAVLDLFRHTTVRALAEHLAPEDEGPRLDKARSLAAQQRRARGRRRPRR